MLCIILCFQGAICSPNVSSWPWKHQQAASYSLVNKPFNGKSSISGFLDFYILFKNCDFSLPAILLYRNQQLLYLDFWFSENRALLNQLFHHFHLPAQTDHHYHVGNQTHSPFSDRSVSDCCSQGCGRTIRTSTFLIIFSTGAKTSTFAELVKKMEAMQRMTQTKASF
jgi:hypothetical protein